MLSRCVSESFEVVASGCDVLCVPHVKMKAMSRRRNGGFGVDLCSWYGQGEGGCQKE